MELTKRREREWRPALRAAGASPHRRISDMRHTYATWSLAADVSLFTLSRRNGGLGAYRAPRRRVNERTACSGELCG